MSNARFEPIWKIMSEFNFKFNIKKDDDLICSICNKIMNNACNGPCGCRFCLKCISTYLDGEEKFCPNDLNYCKEEMMKINENIFTDQAINVRITNLDVNCPFNGCQFRDKLRDIENHIRMCEKKKEKCPYLDIGCNEQNIDLSEINDHLSKENFSHTKLLFDYINNLRNEIESLKEQMKTIKYNTEQIIVNVDQLETTSLVNDNKIAILNNDNEIQNENLKIIESKITKLTSKMKSIGNASTKEKYGELEWIIENYYEKLHNARNGINKSLYSNSFYSHKLGYKMCLRVDPDGYQDGAETHLSIYFCIMQGAYDNQLSWPCKVDVTLSIMNQQTNRPEYNAVVKYEINKTEDAYNKPKNERNTSLGYYKYIQMNKILGNAAIIQDDQILVKCTIQILQ